jgi:AraC-like DNA-binding protein
LNYALAHRSEEVLIHRVIGGSYVGRCADPLLSIKCMYGGVGRYRDDAGRDYAVDDDCYLILNRGNGYTVEKSTPTPMETFCIFFPDNLVAGVARDLTRDAGALLDEPAPAGGSAFNLIEHRHAHQGPVAGRIASIRAAAAAGGLTDVWLEEAMLELSAGLVGAQHLVRSRMARLPWARAATRRELYRRIHVARDRLHACLAEPFSLAETAREAALSPYHFLRAFRAILGVTPRSYVTAERVARARRLLEQTSLSVTEVAAEVGYESLPSFVTLFRARTGLTPARYRRAWRQSRNPR